MNFNIWILIGLIFLIVPNLSFLFKFIHLPGWLIWVGIVLIVIGSLKQ